MNIKEIVDALEYLLSCHAYSAMPLHPKVMRNDLNELTEIVYELAKVVENKQCKCGKSKKGIKL